MQQQVATLDLTVGNIQLERGYYRSALRCYNTALHEFETIGDPLQVARCHQNRGFTLTRLGRVREALSELDLARAAFERLGERAGAARAANNRGTVLMGIGRYSAALKELESAFATAREVGLQGWLGRVNASIADCYLALNRPREALDSLSDEPNRMNEIENPQDALALAVRRFAALYALGSIDDARIILAEVEDRFPDGAIQHRAELRALLAASTLEGGDAVEAEMLALSAERLARQAGMRQLAASAGLVRAKALFTLGRVDRALTTTQATVRLAHREGISPLAHRALELLGRIAEAQGRQAAARRHYQLAIHEVERQQPHVIFEFRDSFALSRGEAYERLVALQLREGQHTDAFITAERAKSRALADAIAGVIEPNPRRTKAARRMARELRNARTEYAAAVASAVRAEDTERECNVPEQVNRLPLLESKIRRLVAALQVVGTSEVDSAEVTAGAAPDALRLPPGTLLVEYFICADGLVRFAADERGLTATPIADDISEVERLLRSFRLNLDAVARSTPDRRPSLETQARAVLHRLYDRLLGGLPLEQYQRLVIIPHGLLHYLPFHALHDGSRYLIERLPVVYAPSAAVYEVCRSRRPRGSSALVIGHSAGGRLPATQDEARSIASLLRVPVYLEEQASRRLLEQQRGVRLLHVAAHGQFRADAPLFSRIELNDGPLTTADIYDLQLRGAVVVLSACETGRTFVGGGDELAGMTRAFLCAGASGLMVSQWRVDDVATCALMTDFYAAVASGTGTASALAEAQTKLAQGKAASGHTHPFFWAGFQMSGSDAVLYDRSRRRQPLRRA
jgi:CHAT domain-containing protein